MFRSAVVDCPPTALNVSSYTIIYKGGLLVSRILCQTTLGLCSEENFNIWTKTRFKYSTYFNINITPWCRDKTANCRHGKQSSCDFVFYIVSAIKRIIIITLGRRIWIFSTSSFSWYDALSVRVIRYPWVTKGKPTFFHP